MKSISDIYSKCTRNIIFLLHLLLSKISTSGTIFIFLFCILSDIAETINFCVYALFLLF